MTQPDMKPIPSDATKADHDLSSGVGRVALPREVAGAANLMMTPLAGMAAMSALGLTVASQAFGMWAGAFAAAASVSRQPAPSKANGTGSAPSRVAPVDKASAGSSTPAVVTSIAEARAKVARLARERVQPKPAPVEPAAKVEPVAVPVATKSAGLAPVADASGVKTASKKPAAVERPQNPDDLKTISGIGPKLEQVLNGLGIWRFAQVAAWTPAEIAWLDDHLGFSGRIGRDDWLGQATGLSARKAGG